MTSYSYAERDKAYALIDQSSNLVEMVEKMGTGQMAANPDIQAAIASMTGASDLKKQHEAMTYLHKQITSAHRKRIIAASREDFTCYVEAISPGEACRSQVHRFIAEQFMSMEAQPDQKMALSMPPGHAKDLCVTTPVLMGDGTSKRLGDVEIGDFVITHTGEAREVIETHDQGIRETLILETLSGREIRAHPDHPFLTPAGWIPAKDLVPGDVLAQQREFSISNTSGRTRDEFALAGYIMAYGFVRNRAYSRLKQIDLKFRTDDPVILEDVMEIAQRLGYSATSRYAMTYGEEVRTLSFGEPFRYWLENQNLWMQTRHEMRIPEWVFKGSYTEIGAFVGAIFSMDAFMKPSKSKHTGAQNQLLLRVRNVGLVKDLRRLLMRLGARSTLSKRLENCYNYEPTLFWTLVIHQDEDIAFLRKALRIVGVNRRFWETPIAVRRFFDNRYAEDKIVAIRPSEPTETKCLTVEVDHSFLADGIAVHNSTYGSRLFPSWWMGKRENKKWLQAGHTQKFAEKEFGKKLRDSIIGSQGWNEVFPDVGLRGSSQDEIILTNDCSYVVKGVGQGISGYRSHFNCIDDPYPTEKAAQSPVIRESVWHWFTNDFRTRRLPGSGELIIVTRWHSDDIVGRMEELIAEAKETGEGMEPWTIINLPAFSQGEDVDQLKRKEGEVLWPEFFTRKYLLDIKAPMLESRWQSLYQGSPVMSEGNILRRAWIKYYTDLPQGRVGDPANSEAKYQKLPSYLRPKGPSEFSAENSNSATRNPHRRLRTVISVDSAEKDTVRADFSAIQCWIEGTDRKHYLADSLRGKFEFPQLVEQIENMAKKWEADLILCETKGAGNQYIQARTGHSPCAIVGYSPGRDSKDIRFEGTMTMWQGAEVLLPERSSWVETYIDQLLRFPFGKNDDDVDATSQYLNWARAGGGWRRGVKKLG